MIRRVLFALCAVAVLTALALPNSAVAQDSPQDGDAGAPAVENAAPPQEQLVDPWYRWLHDPYHGTPDRPYGTATTIYYPWPGIPYHGPRYYGFRPGWFGAGYPTSESAGFWW